MRNCLELRAVVPVCYYLRKAPTTKHFEVRAAHYVLSVRYVRRACTLPSNAVSIGAHTWSSAVRSLKVLSEDDDVLH